MAAQLSSKLTMDGTQHNETLRNAAKELSKYKREVDNSNKQLKQFKKDSSNATRELSNMINAAKNGNIAGIFSSASNGAKSFTSSLSGLKSQLGNTNGLIDALGGKAMIAKAGILGVAAAVAMATKELYDYNKELSRQDQVTSVTTGLSGVDASRMTDQAKALASTYDVDFREAINAANTLMTQFGLTGDEAINLIKDGMQGMIIGDGGKLLSMIQQYAPTFRDAGIEASQLVAIIHNTEGGIFSDENMNAIVMGIKNIKLMKDTTKEALAEIGIDGAKMSEQINNGTMSIFEALELVTGTLKNTSAQSKEAGEVMQAVFGKQGVTAGHNLSEAIATLNINLEQTKSQTGELGESFAELQTANEKLNTAIRDCFALDGVEGFTNHIKSSLITALASVLSYIGKIKKSLSGVVQDAKQAADNAKEADKPKPQGKYVVKTVDGQVVSAQHYDLTGNTNTKTNNTNKKTNKKSSGGGKTQIDYALGSVGYLENKIQELQKKIKLQVDASEIQKLNNEIKAAKDQLELLLNPQTIELKELSPMSVLSEKPKTPDKIDKDYSPTAIYAETQDKIDNVMQMYNIGAIGADKAKEFIDSFNSQLQALGLKPIQVDIETNTKKVASSISEIGSAFQDLGSAIQMPELNVMGTIAQAIANVALGFAEAQKSPANTAGGVFTWVGAALTGLGAMTSIIASIKSATAYAEGGIINGRTSIGDLNIARVNNGEMILNGRQQQNLFNAIDNNRLGTQNITVNGEWKLKGQDLYMSMKNYGKGQLKLGKNIGIY